MSDSTQTFHVGDAGSNPAGDASTYEFSTGTLTPISPQSSLSPSKPDLAGLDVAQLAALFGEHAWGAPASGIRYDVVREWLRRAFPRIRVEYAGPLTLQEREALKDRLAAGSTPMPNGCREWRGRTAGKGYGQLYHRGRNYAVHRLAYELYYENVPRRHVLHECDNPPCCNPEHLYEGSNADNVRDRMERGRDADRRGELNGRHILTEADVLAIRSEYAAGRRGYGLVTHGSLAAKYGVAKITVSQILSKKLWKHLGTRQDGRKPNTLSIRKRNIVAELERRLEQIDLAEKPAARMEVSP